MKLLFAVAGASLACAGVVGYVRYLEGRTLYYPTSPLEVTPADSGLPFEDVVFTSSDGIRLHGWFISAPGSARVLLFCHGNAGNISHRIEKAAFFHRLGLHCFIFDYRGYGKSGGTPSEEGLYRDVRAAYAFLASRGFTPRNVIGYGESLGGAVIIDAASDLAFGALIVESTFSSATDMAHRIYPFIPSWIFASRFSSDAKIGRVAAPKLIIHSGNDEVVPFELAQKLYRAALPPKEMLRVHGSHNTCFYDSLAAYEQGVSGFLKKATGG